MSFHSEGSPVAMSTFVETVTVKRTKWEPAGYHIRGNRCLICLRHKDVTANVVSAVANWLSCVPRVPQGHCARTTLAMLPKLKTNQR